MGHQKCAFCDRRIPSNKKKRRAGTEVLWPKIKKYNNDFGTRVSENDLICSLCEPKIRKIGTPMYIESVNTTGPQRRRHGFSKLGHSSGFGQRSLNNNQDASRSPTHNNYDEDMPVPPCKSSALFLSFFSKYLLSNLLLIHVVCIN